ncbi:ArpU family transcriptional regulator [Bacillus sp. CMF12]|uniref:ArpU family phage packaging/lysis transcriptional regulator n=1 Tax=Bacillus sp. CMF12 TaxID=2884834 RepID=UPI00207A5361|nr:ArpU family phage packaging/lysis transcriptional regulator [Bacillus sp. CMF12]USK48883.1 ArpU family transcriptional regulator [Bacillus sp. CMF12]
MKERLEFQLAAIDREETKKRVEGALEKYRIMILSQDMDQLPTVTQNFTLVPPTNTNKFHSSTEDAAIYNADYNKEKNEYIKKILSAVNRLGYKQRGILIKRYMTEEEIYDYQVYSELHMSERTYHRHKSKALYELAFALNIEVYEEQAVGIT